MGLAEILVAVGVAAVVSHVDGRHFGDVEGAVIPEVLECSREDSGGDGGMVVSCENERGLALVSAEYGRTRAERGGAQQQRATARAESIRERCEEEEGPMNQRSPR